MFDTKTAVLASTVVVAASYTRTVIRKRSAKKALQAYREQFVTFENDFGGYTTCHIDYVESIKSILDHMH